MSEKIYTFPNIEQQKTTNMGMQDLVKAIYDETEEEIRSINEKANEWAKIVLYTFAMPQIKGEITKNKLRWREILHYLAIKYNWDNVYSGGTLPSGNLGTIKIEERV